MAPALEAAPAWDDMTPLLARAMDLRRRAESTSRIVPTADQRTLIIVACVYIVAILLLWNIPYLKVALLPFKLLTVGFHEFSHAIVGLCTGAKIESIHLDPNEGGATRMRGGIPFLTLPAGYLGSSFIGAAMIATAFDIRASKVMTIIIGVFFLLTLWWARRDWLTWVLLLCMAGLIVAFWFIAHGIALQYLVLFLVRSVWFRACPMTLCRLGSTDRIGGHRPFSPPGCHVVSLFCMGHLRRSDLVSGAMAA